MVSGFPPQADQVSVLLSAAACDEPIGREPFGREPFGRELRVERLRVERLRAERLSRVEDCHALWFSSVI